MEDLLKLIIDNTEEVLLVKELEAKLALGRKLRVKLGFDPTAKDLHLGHMVVLNKLKVLQDLGHTIMIVIGDFTAMIGDPTGKTVTRPSLSATEVKANTTTYLEQISKILDSAKLEIYYNSSWLESLGVQGLIKLASTKTVARMLEREDFAKRFANQQPIAIHEFLYPLLQAYDSLHLKADIELGGIDQKFNLLIGRELQKHYNYEPQCCIMMPILEGINGVDKMSKSLNNYIAINDSYIDIFGKIMSISDDLLWNYLHLLSSKTNKQIDTIKQQAGFSINPRDIKIEFAKEIVTKFYSLDLAMQAEQDFINKFRKKSWSDHIELVTLKNLEYFDLVNILKVLNFATSTSSAIRAIEQGSVKINGEKIVNKNYQLLKNQEYQVQCGKKQYKKIIID